MHSIGIDFDVFKALTAMRSSESVTYNDVIRGLLKLPTTAVKRPTNANDGDWTCKGVTFPAGTRFRAEYKGRTYYGSVERGTLVVEGKQHNNPSNAAMTITRNNVNGWDFWYCQFPNETEWRRISTLRM